MLFKIGNVVITGEVHGKYGSARAQVILMSPSDSTDGVHSPAESVTFLVWKGEELERLAKELNELSSVLKAEKQREPKF